MEEFRNKLAEIYPVCFSVMAGERLDWLIASMNKYDGVESFGDQLALFQCEFELPEYISDLALLELVRYQVGQIEDIPARHSDKYELNPTLQALHFSENLLPLFEDPLASVEKTENWVLIWKKPETDELEMELAGEEELLALKLISEDISPLEAAEMSDSHVGKICSSLIWSAERGLISGPPSSIRRNIKPYSEGLASDPDNCDHKADSFTIQWHVTSYCDCDCKHCYDRSQRAKMDLDKAISILDDLQEFCWSRNVFGHVCFTGGNPFMYEFFSDVYAEAAMRGFSISILGNPVEEKELEEILLIQKPAYFQISLEGKEQYSDSIRGKGHFKRSLDFLELLKKYEIESSVMLTLAKDNMDQVIPLSETLRDKTDYFTFNRLSPVGKGKTFELPTRDEYASFMKNYVHASRNNPIMGFKDNLANIVLEDEGEELCDGCTGYGCGAAFNFLVVLPDGETHACRKFDSRLGNVFEQKISEIYDSELARKYRKGSDACADCRLRKHCGSCLSVASGLGADIFKDPDPHCFIDQ